jgi:hypothetical protein
VTDLANAFVRSNRHAMTENVILGNDTVDARTGQTDDNGSPITIFEEVQNAGNALSAACRSVRYQEIYMTYKEVQTVTRWVARGERGVTA